MHLFQPCGLQRLGRIHAAAFSDEVLYAEMVNKAAFWVQQSYFGIDLTALYAPALSGYFAQVCFFSSLKNKTELGR